jgi:hypothetical protein
VKLLNVLFKEKVSSQIKLINYFVMIISRINILPMMSIFAKEEKGRRHAERTI